ncbi:hypothetical protein E5D57_012550 [Metarhizium anisopliae]|nr:hypothetical protein E5D57_012550 [Metarhizium anisopliae]
MRFSTVKTDVAPSSTTVMLEAIVHMSLSTVILNSASARSCLELFEGTAKESQVSQRLVEAR